MCHIPLLIWYHHCRTIGFVVVEPSFTRSLAPSLPPLLRSPLLFPSPSFLLPNILGLSVQGKVFAEEGAYSAWPWGGVSAFSPPELPVSSQQC